MSDITELGETALKVVGAGWTLQKLIGPTLDYFGESLRGGVEKRAQNVRRILVSAASKLGDPDRLPEGGVSPRVIKDVWEEASFFDDELAAEYFGGILAADRLSDVADDQAAAWTQLVARLSTLAIRTHYILYGAAHERLQGSGVNFGASPPTGGEGRVYVPWSVWAGAVGLDSEGQARTWDQWADALYMLQDEGLLGDKDHGGWSLKPVENLKSQFPLAEEPGAIFLPSYRGVKLFVVAHGMSQSNATFTTDELQLPVQVVSIPSGSRRVDELKRPLVEPDEFHTPSPA